MQGFLFKWLNGIVEYHGIILICKSPLFYQLAWFEKVCRHSHWYSRKTARNFWWREETLSICIRGGYGD